MESIIEKLKDGGPGITCIILLVFFIIVVLVVLTALKKGDDKKYRSLISSLGWFALAWGYLGRTLGLIMAFDKIASAGDITPSLMAGGLKMALIGPLMGLFTFAMARLALIIFTSLEKKAGNA